MTDRRSATDRQPPIAPIKRPSTAGTPLPSIDISSYNNLFVAMALTMSWQLAIVVIVPIVGGHLLDDQFNTLPVLTLVGLVVAIIGVVGVLYRMVRVANERVANLDAKAGRK